GKNGGADDSVMQIEVFGDTAKMAREFLSAVQTELMKVGRTLRLLGKGNACDVEVHERDGATTLIPLAHGKERDANRWLAALVESESQRLGLPVNFSCGAPQDQDGHGVIASATVHLGIRAQTRIREAAEATMT